MSPAIVIAIGCDRAGAEALHGAEGDQRGHAPGHAAQDPEQEQPDPEQHDRLAPEQVGELAVHRHRHRLGQQVHREQPGELGEPAEVGDDRGHRGRDDGGVERDQAGGQHQRDQDRPALGAQADAAAGGRAHTQVQGGVPARHSRGRAGDRRGRRVHPPPRTREARSCGRAARLHEHHVYIEATHVDLSFWNVPMNSKTAAPRHAGQISLFGAMKMEPLIGSSSAIIPPEVFFFETSSRILGLLRIALEFSPRRDRLII